VRNVSLSVLGAWLMLAALPPLATAATASIPKCSGRVVWVVPAEKIYVLSNNPKYGKKPGTYVCESHAIARGYKMQPLDVGHPVTHSMPSHPTAAPSSTVATTENPNLTNLARAQIDVFRTGKINRSQYGPQLNSVLTDTVVTQWSQLLALSGAVTSFTYAGSTNISGLPVTQYVVTFQHPISLSNGPSTNQWIEQIAIDQTGKIVYLSFAPKT
jgi:hypothetical protein